MNDVNSHILRALALKIKRELASIDKKDAILKEAAEILDPLIFLALNGRILELPNNLPRPQLFFGMQEDSLAAWHLEKVELLNAIAEFGVALRLAKES